MSKESIGYIRMWDRPHNKLPARLEKLPGRWRAHDDDGVLEVNSPARKEGNGARVGGLNDRGFVSNLTCRNIDKISFYRRGCVFNRFRCNLWRLWCLGDLRRNLWSFNYPSRPHKKGINNDSEFRQRSPTPACHAD